MTFESTLSKYETCTRCVMSAHRRHVVHGRGGVPADILFIGEAPGKTEDLLGESFRGVAGRKLNSMIATATKNTGITPAYYITTIVCCRPCDEAGGPNREPTDQEAHLCQSHLADVLSFAKPTHVIFLGQVAARYGASLCPDGITLPHPHYLLSLGSAGDALLRGAMRTLEAVFRGELE